MNRISVVRSRLGIEVHAAGKAVLCLTDADASHLGGMLLGAAVLGVVKPIVECKVCRIVLYDDAAKDGYCTDHEPKSGGRR